MQKRIVRILGAVGALAYVVIFIHTPSFPTPDKIFILLILLGMASGQALEVLKRFTPFVALLLVYESFRGLASQLNSHVNYTFMIQADRLLGFGTLPTTALQRWLWHGHVQWYDLLFYGAYTLHFVLPFGLAVLIWKKRPEHYWQFITAIVTVSFAAFLTYLLFPAAPPWLASDKGYIEPIAHVSSFVWAAFGIHDFPSVYNKISPNLVAAVPSLHAAYAFLFAFFSTRLFKTKWRFAAWIYPVLIWFGTVYMGEHYLIDAILGVIYAAFFYWTAPYIVRWLEIAFKKLLHTVKNVL